MSGLTSKLIPKGDIEKKFNFDRPGTYERISGVVLLESKSFFSLRQVQEVEQTFGVLTFCVVSLVILQTGSYEQHATNFTMLQNNKYLCFYGSKCHKMFPLDQQYDARSI